MEYLEELVENMSFEECSYLYYITEKGNSEDIFGQGIALEDKSILNQEYLSCDAIKDPVKFCKKVLKKETIKEKELFVIESIKGEEDKIIFKNYEPVWNADSHIKYLIEPQNIMCSIDLDSLMVTYNLDHHYSSYSRG